MSSSVTATFVFTDLVDSTATAARLGPEAAEELRQTHFRLLRGAVASSGGTEVKNLGDGLMVMYSSPTRALSGAAGMQQAIEHHNRFADEPLGVRIGISLGEAAEDEGDYFGDPVVEAARVCAAAQGGQILATDVLRAVVGRHATQSLVELGPLELKGLPEPVDVVEVIWEPAVVEGSVPLPSRLVGVATDALFGFFGRIAELGAMEEAFKAASASHRCQAVFVAGEAGMGKTSLTAQAARRANAEGATVLFGHADEDLDVAYQPWIEALTFLVRDGDAGWVSGLRSAQRAALSRLVPEAGSRSGGVTDPETERVLLLEGATELLVAASAQSPVLVVLDDLHWADTASLQLLRHVISSTASMNVSVACTYRDTDLVRGDPLTKLLADLHRETNVTRIALAGLEDNELVELLAAAAGHDLDDDGVGLAHAMRRETSGNPFFASELLRHLSETDGIVVGADGRWSLAGEFDELGLPSSVRDVVGRRVERLGEDALRVLCLAAVIGREFDVDVLVGLAEVGEDSLLDLLDAAVGAAVLVESDAADRYRFAHALTRHSLYDELSPTRRQRAHQRIAVALESRGFTEDAAMLAELAHHWVAATRPADLGKALDYVRRAGDAARDALAPDDAIRWYQQALDFIAQQATPAENERAELLLVLGTVQCQAEHPEYRDALLQAGALADRLDRTDLLVEAALGFGQYFGIQTGDDDAKPLIRSALDRHGKDPTPTRARLLAKLTLTHDAATEAHERRALALEAVDTARQTDDDATFIDAIEATHLTLATPDRLDQHLADLQRALTNADRLGDPLRQVRTRMAAMWARYQQADISGAGTTLDEMESLDEMVGLPFLAFQHMQFTTGRLLLAGRAADADAANERMLEVGTAAPDALSAYGGLLYAIRWHQGRLEEIADFFLEVASDNPSLAALRATVPLMLCDLDRFDEARELLAVEVATNFDFPFDAMWLASMANVADAAAALEDRPASRVVIEHLSPYADHVISPAGIIVSGAVARPLARAATLLGDHDKAEQWFAIAHGVHARLQTPFWTAHGQLDHADLCRTRRADGDLERADELLALAADTAAQFGFSGLTRRADKLLAGL